jgi:hypothetical protein
VLNRAAVGAQGLSTRDYKRDVQVCGRWAGYGAIIKNSHWGERTETTTTTPCGDCPRCQTVAALASCTAACRASATLMRRHCLWLGIDRPVIPPGRARTKAASGHLDERLPPTTAELLENSDEYELHDQIRQKWPPLSPETLRGRSPVSDALEHGIFLLKGGLIVGRGTQRNACQEGQRRAVLARPPQPEEQVQPQGMLLLC